MRVDAISNPGQGDVQGEAGVDVLLNEVECLFECDLESDIVHA